MADPCQTPKPEDRNYSGRDCQVVPSSRFEHPVTPLELEIYAGPPRVQHGVMITDKLRHAHHFILGDCAQAILPEDGVFPSLVKRQDPIIPRSFN